MSVNKKLLNRATPTTSKLFSTAGKDLWPRKTCPVLLAGVGVFLLLAIPGLTMAEETALSKLAKGMKAGQWAELKDNRPSHLMSVLVGQHPSGKDKRFHIAGWTDDGHWDPATQQFLFMGYRVRNKFIAYSAKTNRWRVIPEPYGWNTPGQGTFEDTRKKRYGHVYGRNALDSEHGIYYMTQHGYTFAFDLRSETWSRTKGKTSMSIEYFPGLGLLAHEIKPLNNSEVFSLNLLNTDSGTWEHFTTLPFSGYHAFARYNPIRDEMIFVGGNDSRSVVALKRDGSRHKLADLPFDMTIRRGKVVVEPASGHYLIFHDHQLFELNPDLNQYRKVDDFKEPWGKYEMPVPATIPELGVILFVDDKTLLYKHKPQSP